jgi:Abortive infection C-terminus
MATMNDLEKKQEHRRRFLWMLYEETGGRRFTFAVATDIKDKLGLTDDEFTATTDYLVGRGWMKWETLDWKASITPSGVEEVEQAMAADMEQPSGPRIPPQAIGEVAAIFEQAYTHDQLTTLFLRVGVTEEYSAGTKPSRIRRLLQQIDADAEVDAHALLGRLLQEFMDREPPRLIAEDPDRLNQWNAPRHRIREVLAASGLSYHTGGKIIGGSGLLAPSKTLADFIRDRDLTAIGIEFDRAYAAIATDPASAVTAACAILEATCHTYIADEKLTPPADKSIHPLWKVVQGHLGIAPTAALDDDLKKVLGGLAAIVDGVGAFRTHAGDAHGRGPGAPSIEPRHARLAVHAAHTVVTFILETWKRKPK